MQKYLGNNLNFDSKGLHVMISKTNEQIDTILFLYSIIQKHPQLSVTYQNELVSIRNTIDNYLESISNPSNLEDQAPHKNINLLSNDSISLLINDYIQTEGTLNQKQKKASLDINLSDYCYTFKCVTN